MESQQQQHHQEDINNGGGKISGSSSYLCRQSSTRWTPTTEQIKLLKELYYINGVRSPTADQIQSICARLRRYGKIEGKNVFYWFQNHKARERQKKRLTPNANPILPAPNTNQYHNENNNNIIRNGNFQWKQDQDRNKYSSFNNNSGFSCSSSSVGVVTGGGQSMGNFGYGAVTLENTFRECSITGGILNGGNVNHNSQWHVGNYNPYSPPTYCSNFLDKISSIEEYHDYEKYDDDDDDEDDDVAPAIETLPLFPTHEDDHKHNQSFYTIKPGTEACYTSSYRCSNGNNGSASLELSLNSYGYTQYL